MQFRGLNEISSLPIPIAMTLSKSDLLGKTRPVSDPFYFLSHNPAYNDFELQDVLKVNYEIKDFLEKFEEKALLNAAQNLSYSQFFAVSATGHSPDANGLYPEVYPHRCLDPIYWILYQLGVIESL